MDDFKKITYSVLGGFAVLMVVWLGFIFVNSCGLDVTCQKGAAPIYGTPIPTLIPATLPAPTRFIPKPAIVEAETTIVPPLAGETSDVPQPSNPGGPGEAVNLTGDATVGAQLFATNCVSCHGENGVGGTSNPGSTKGTVPALNPINPKFKGTDQKTFASNLDLFIQHGSTPAGTSPVFNMPAWGDLGALTQQQIADIITYLISLNP
jgi:mono/diheme cytochrome c family protein